MYERGGEGEISDVRRRAIILKTNVSPFENERLEDLVYRLLILIQFFSSFS